MRYLYKGEFDEKIYPRKYVSKNVTTRKGKSKKKINLNKPNKKWRNKNDFEK